MRTIDWSIALSAIALVASCGGTDLLVVRGNRPDASSGGAGGFSGDGEPDASVTMGGNGGINGVPPDPPLCGGVRCTGGQVCCLLDGKCFDPSPSPSPCVAPTGMNSQGQKNCASNADCAPTEFCQASSYDLCLGAGYCVRRDNCGTCEGGGCTFCGCDGRVYPSVQSACLAGARGHMTKGPESSCWMTHLSGGGGVANGVVTTYCSTSATCPGGEECCYLTGLCYDPAYPGRCATPPAGSRVPCTDDNQCNVPQEYCAGLGCDEPGGCVTVGSSVCSGEFAPVCGCNGKTYTNSDCARSAGARIRSMGTCEGG